VCLLALAAAAACATPDPRAELEIVNLETYWAIDSPAGGTQYLAPVVRFEVRNKGSRSRRSVQAMATLRRQGETVAWSSAWSKVAPIKDQPLLAGQSAPAFLKPEGEGRYSSTGAPESMFQHAQWKDVTAEVFLRVDTSQWTKFGDFPVARHIGAKGIAP
jgi:hypothetical protein